MNDWLRTCKPVRMALDALSGDHSLESTSAAAGCGLERDEGNWPESDASMASSVDLSPAPGATLFSLSGSRLSV